MPRRTEAEALETRNFLVQSAKGILAERGYENLSLEFLAAECGVTRGAVYHHFGSKEGLFLFVVERILSDMGRRIVAAAEAPAAEEFGPLGPLLRGSREFLESSQKPEYQQIILTDAPSVLGISQWQELDDRYTTSTLVEAFSELTGLTHSGYVDALAAAFSGALNQLSRWIQSDQDLEHAMNVLERMLESLLNTR
jgi:AcrR family transcriptional regulator